MQQSYDVVIIGGGVVGSAIARELSRYKLRIAVLEKESDVCTQTSGRNTGMLHAGFLYKTSSLKAICAVEGNQEFDQVARELDVPFKRTGKLIVGFTDEHRQRLEQFMARGEANGVKGLELIDRKRMDELDPSAGGNFAMWCPAVFWIPSSTPSPWRRTRFTTGRSTTSTALSPARPGRPTAPTCSTPPGATSTPAGW